MVLIKMFDGMVRELKVVRYVIECESCTKICVLNIRVFSVYFGFLDTTVIA